MEEKVIRGIRWTLLANASTRVVTLATTLVLARILVPSDFGIFAFGLLVVLLATQFGGLGLASAVVVRQDLDRRQLGTALTMLIGLNAAIAGILAAASPLTGSLIGGSDAAGVLAALAIPVAFGGITSFYAALLQRELLFRRRFVCQGAQVAGMAVASLLLAELGAGVWSLVGGQIAGAISYTAFLIALAPYRVRTGVDRAAARALWSSGRGFMLQGGFSFLEQNADYLIVGGILGSRSLGLYSMAYRISELPYTAVVDPIAQATFPGFARMRHRSQDVGPTFVTALGLIVQLTFPLGVLVSGAADPLVATFLGPKWSGMVGLLSVLGLWGSLRTVQATIGWFVNAIDLSWNVGRAYALMLVVTIPILIAAAVTGGAQAVAWVMVGNMLVMTGIVATIASRHAGISVLRQWRAVRSSVVAAGPAWVAAAAVSALTTDAAPALSLVGCLLAGLAVYVAVVLLLDGRTALRDWPLSRRPVNERA